MRKIPPEIDLLMWAVAENRDTKAIDEFEQRYPDLKIELGKRLAMMNGLKGAQTAVAPRQIPRFVPKPEPAPVWSRRPLAVAAAGLMLMALAFGSFFVARNLSTPPSREPDEQPVLQVNRGVDQEAPVIQYPPTVQETDPPRPEIPPQSELPQNTVPLYMRPSNLEVSGAPFLVVLEMIEQSCSLEIEMPHVPDELAAMTVDISYRNMNGLQMLEDMGKRYGFTAFHQGKGKVLIVPARAGSEGETRADEQRAQGRWPTQ